MSLKEKNRIVIPVECPVQSLCWEGEELVDWAGGGIRFALTGETKKSNIRFGDQFDRAVVSLDRRFAVLYEVLGTKGLVVCGREHTREINRCDYYARTYEYPIAIFSLPDGTQALAHCPDAYNKIEIEELSSGRRLTERIGKGVDFFHSRLQVSPGGTYLVSAGWVWQPIDAVQIFLVADVLKSPEQLDQYDDFGLCGLPSPVEITHATFQSDDVLLLAGHNGEGVPPKIYLVGYSLGDKKVLFSTPMEEIPGTIMPLGTEHVVGFYGHPKLFENCSGKVVHEWPGLKSGQQDSSIIRNENEIPPLALDPAHKRFAIADEKQITVIQLA